MGKRLDAVWREPSRQVNRGRVLKISLEPFPIPPIGADVTLLLAGSSFITTFDAKEDPRAAEAFLGLCTAYCNGSDLILPLPRRTVEEIPLFYRLWEQRAALTKLPDAELSDVGFSAIAKPGAQDFAAYAEGAPWDVARWIAFQFSASIADRFLERSDVDVITRVAPFAAKLSSKNRLPRLESALLTLQQDQALTIPGIYEHLVGGPRIHSFTHLCIAYALSVSLRGYSYAAALGRYPNSPLYRHHWIRAPIVRRIGSVETDVQVKQQRVTFFPWGDILVRVFDAERPLTKRHAESVAAVLQGLRNLSTKVRDGVQLGMLENIETRPESTRVTDAEAFVLDLLREVGAVPRYANSNVLHQLVRWLRDIVGKEHPLWRVPIEVVTASLQPAWLRKPESMFRMRFKRDSFWSVLEDPGIRRALRLAGRDESNRV